MTRIAKSATFATVQRPTSHPICPPLIPVGTRLICYGVPCLVTRHLDFGTLDAESLDGRRAYRVTGLPFVR